MTQKKYIDLLTQSMKDWRFWVKLLIGLAQITSIIVFLTVSVVVEKDWYLLAEHLPYFTTLSNLFCGIFFIYSAFFHHNEGQGKFNNIEVAKIALTYITMTILIYNIGQLMRDTPYVFDNWKFIMSLICEHTFVPIFAIIYCLFFYNHKNAKNIKEFNKKWIWYMILGLLGYLVFFSIIGFIGKAANWKPLYGTSDKPSTFIYPFMDWYNGVGLFENIPAWFECIIVLIFIILVAALFDYIYTFIILSINKSNWYKKLVAKK